MSSLKLKHSGGNSVIIAAPSSNPAADRTITLNDNYAGDGSFVTANSSGNVGIGTASPAEELVVRADAPSIQLESSNASGRNFGLQAQNDGNFSFYDGTAGVDRMRIESSGNLQLGRDKYLGTVASGQSTINIGTSGGAQIGFLKSGTNDDELKFYTHQSGVAHAERMSIDPSGDLRVGRIYSNTTSGGANVRVQSDGLLQRDTSSKRYKNTIKDATHGLADLNKLRSVTYKGNNDGDTIFGGLIAEEVHDAGLTEFVDYDSDNQPDALKYGNMVSLCIKAIQELSAKVETLETKVAALEAA